MRLILITLLIYITPHAIGEENIVFSPGDTAVEDIVFSPTDRPVTIGEKNIAVNNKNAFRGVPLKNGTLELKCSFTVRDFAGGASNEATCAKSPHEVFSSKWTTQNKAEHCQVPAFSEVRLVEEFNNFSVLMRFSKSGNFTKGIVIYDLVTGPSNAFIESLIAKSELEGKSPDEVYKKYQKRTFNKYYSIDNIAIQKTEVTTDLITKEILDFDNHYEIPLYVIQFDNRSLYFSEASSEAVIISYAQRNGYSWVNQKFGTCGFL